MVPTMEAQPLRRSLRLTRPLDLGLTFRGLRNGQADPTMRIAASTLLRATRNPDGAVTLAVRVEGMREAGAEAWGPGAERALEDLPALLGEEDDDSGFAPRHRAVADLRVRLRGLRLYRTGAVFEALFPTVLAQRVTSGEARSAVLRLSHLLGEPAPGPYGLRLPPLPARLAALPSWDYHRLGVERQRADTLKRCARVAARLEEAAAMPPEAARARLRLVPGVGPWTAAEVAITALGDADAVPVGDYHLPHVVSWALAGEPRGSDERMLDLLEPYRGHRARVLRLLLVGGVHQPRFGPRRPLRRLAAI